MTLLPANKSPAMTLVWFYFTFIIVLFLPYEANLGLDTTLRPGSPPCFFQRVAGVLLYAPLNYILSKRVCKY